MRPTCPPVYFRLGPGNAFCCLLALAACCGCSPDSPADRNLSAGNEPPAAAVTIDAVWSSRPPAAREKLPPVYGDCVDLLADGLLLACGEKPSWRSNVVVCYEQQLTAVQAGVLVDTSDDLFLPNLQMLTPGAARALGQSNGILSLPAVKSLGSAAAAGLAGRRESLMLSGLTELTAEAAVGLARSAGPLKLDGLHSLAPGVAAALADHVGHLCLNGVGQLSESDAIALARHQGDICLNGIHTLPAEAAEAVAGLRYGLHLNGLADISVPAAFALAGHRGWTLGLNRLHADQLPPQVAALLSRRAGRWTTMVRVPERLPESTQLGASP